MPTVTSKVKNRLSGCLMDSQRMLAQMYVDDEYKEQRKGAEIHSKCDYVIIIYLDKKQLIFCSSIPGFHRIWYKRKGRYMVYKYVSKEVSFRKG